MITNTRHIALVDDSTLSIQNWDTGEFIYFKMRDIERGKQKHTPTPTENMNYKESCSQTSENKSNKQVKLNQGT